MFGTRYKPIKKLKLKRINILSIPIQLNLYLITGQTKNLNGIYLRLYQNIFSISEIKALAVSIDDLNNTLSKISFSVWKLCEFVLEALCRSSTGAISGEFCETVSAVQSGRETTWYCHGKVASS